MKTMSDTTYYRRCKGYFVSVLRDGKLHDFIQSGVSPEDARKEVEKYHKNWIIKSVSPKTVGEIIGEI